jgi:hypothetical protein
MKLIKTIFAALAVCAIASPVRAQSMTQAQVQAAASQAYGIAQNARGTSRANLPPVNLDSFVQQAGGMAQMIYGDEGDVDIPPLDSFTKASRINAGITGINSAGLTTGHGSFLPDAWGGDEKTGNEWDMAGQSMNPLYNIEATLLNATQAAQAAAARSTLPLAGAALGAVANTAANSAGSTASNITSTADVNGTPLLSYMANPPAWVSAFGQWATQTVPYAVTEGMKPVQDSQNGQLMGWMAPGDSLSTFLSGSTGRLLPSETGAAASMLQNLPAGGDFTL